jgi:hypothetical protein
MEVENSHYTFARMRETKIKKKIQRAPHFSNIFLKMNENFTDGTSSKERQINAFSSAAVQTSFLSSRQQN